ncbi:MAG: DUF4249 domain-containing protein [Flavobacteriaceae bacterium]|nr:DUF4249 domain-containing protein [Flavobacteriaceae bacterium]
MKYLYKYIVIFALINLYACTDVIDVEVPEAPPRLVIEASLDWEKGTTGNEQSIKLSLSTPYFDSEDIVSANGALVTVTNTTVNESFTFTDQGNGNYTTTLFIPRLNNEYTLEVQYNNESYIAHETLTSIVPLDAIYQSTEKGFDTEALEVNLDFTDPPNIENFYLFNFKKQGDLLPDLFNFSDDFVDGNEISVFYEKLEDEKINQVEFEPGDVVEIYFYGISKQYFNFMQLLISQSIPSGPFSTTPAALRGNCTNPTNPNNYAFGYFRVTEVVVDSYTFQ